MNYSTAEQMAEKLTSFVHQFPEFTTKDELPRTHIEEDYRIHRWFPNMSASDHEIDWALPTINVIGMMPPVSCIEEMIRLRNAQYPDCKIIFYLDGNLGTCSFYVRIAISLKKK